MSSDTSKMEEVINKPDDQFEDTLIDLIDYGKETSEKEALIKELYQNETSNHHHIKPAASINSSTYSSAASSSSSSSSSSTNSASSTSSTLSSPSQSNLTASKLSSEQDKDNPSKANGNELDEIEMAILEDMGKTATIVEHRAGDGSTNRYLKNFATTATPSFHFHDPRAQYRTSMYSTKTRSTTNNLTNTKSLGPRKKRPVEQPVLSEHIPGHKGGQEVDWLVNFIESGASSQQTNKKNVSNTNTNKRVKPQSKKSVHIENERDIQQSRKSSNVNNISSSGTNNIASNKPTPSSQQRLMQNMQNKPIQNGQRTNQISERKSQQVALNNQKETNHQMTNNTNNKLIRPSRVFKESHVSHSANKPGVKPLPSKHNQEDSQLPIEKLHTAVTFADHIKIGGDDDETTQYTFGFFDEQKPKLMKSSPKSDQRRYKFSDNIDANSFNYKQILEFISKSWKQTMTVKMTKTES